uniref:DBF4-type domain-containing protein n=1 Tax=Anopheles coluzzii TaxID=1518534 RepID=A0A8W7P727_ANOCL
MSKRLNSVEFFLNKDVTHFVTDKLQPTAAVGETGEQQREQPPYCASPSGVVSSAENPARPPHQRQPAPLPPLQRTSRQLLHLTHQQQTHGQYVNDYGPATSRTSSPCPPPITSAAAAAAAAPSSSAGACITTASGATASAQQKHVVAGPAAVSSSTTAASVGFDGKVKSNHHLSSSLSAASSAAAAVPRSRADAMLQRVRQQQQQQQQQQHQHHHQAQPSYSLLHSSPLNPTAYGSTPTKAATPSSIHTSSHHKQAPSPSCYSPSGAAITRTSAATTTAASRQNSPVHQARSWGTLIWSAEYALKFLRKVLASLPQAANGVGDSSKAGRLGGDGRTDASGRSHRHHHRHHQSHGARQAGSQHVHHLRGRFVKIESRSAPGNHRPVYQEFKRWPALLLTDRELAGRKAPFADVHEAPERKQQPVDEQKRKGNVTLEPGGGGGTPVEGTSTSRMTRKLASAANNSVATRTTTTATGKSGETVVKKRAQDKAAAPPRDCGYCEICRIEYDSLAAHVQSDSHQTFVQNDDNFLSLDRLLDSLGGGGDSDETKLAEEDGYDGGEGGGPGGAVAVETFFQQLHSTTRIKRGPGEELLYERRKPPASSAAPQPKAIVGAGGGGAGGDKRQEEKEEEDGAEGRRNKATTVTVAVTTTTTAAADELIERQQQNTTAPIGKEGEQEARSTQVEATVRQALEEEKPAKIATSKEGDDVNSEETKGKPRAKVKRKRTATTSTSTGADCEEEKCEGKDKHGDKDKKALIRLAIQSVIATFDCSDGFLAEVDQTLDDSVRLDDSVVVGKKEKEEESVKEQADKSPAVGESGVSDKRAANSSSSRVSVTNRDSSGKKKEEEVLVGQRTSRVRSCKQQPTEAETAEVSVRRSERKLPGSAFREVREEKEKEKVLSKPAEEPEAASGEGIRNEPQQQQQQEKEKQQQWDERKATDSAAVLDHAAGMKVITDFRTKQQQQQQQEAVEDDGGLVAHKSVLLVGVPATEAKAPAATEDARPEETGTPKTGAGRRKRNPQRAEEDATSMGLKASTTASMNKHHHHHHHHLSESGSGGAAGTKTRHATELAATLLECDGLDPKNTKRISLGLRQNPKRANLNEDFTSLLDETLERSKMSGSSTSVRRTAQSRIRVGPKAKEQHTVVVTPKQQQVEEEPSNRVCEDEAKEAAHDRLKPAAATAGSNKRSSGSAKKTVTLEDIKVRGIRWRAPSPMTRPPVKSPLLYKVIDNQAGGEETVSSSGGINSSRPTATTTTTATGLQASQRKDPTVTGGSTQLPSSAQSRTTCKASKVNGASPGKKNGLIVKIRRVRQSELSLLNDEAENFMFPRKDDSSSDEETDDGRQTSSEGYQGGSANNYSVDITSSSETDRGMAAEDATANEVVMENHSEEDEDEEAAATREEEKRTQQQHRKRAGTIKILTSPRKATTATATQTTALHEQLLHQDADSNGEEPSRSCSRASDRASSRAGSSTGGIKFDRPLFPDSSYVNSRTLCQELDAFLSDELKRVTGSKDGGTTLGAIVKQERSDTGEAEETDERIAIDETADKSETLLEQDDLMMDQELLLPPSVVQEGIAIERNELPVSKRDLLDVLQTVGTEPPLSLKLVQRCESVVKKIVQYDRKERPMVASGTGSGLAISSGSPVIGLQLFDSGSPLAACGPGSGPGSVGGTFLKKRINRTGWPTNKRKIGTRTRQQSRFMLPSSLAGGKKSLSRESIKKEPEEQRGEEKDEEEEDGSLSQQKPQQCAIKAEEPTEKDRSTTVPGPTVDTMPTLRAALMRDNSQLQRLLSSPSSKPPGFSSASPSSILAPGSLNRGTVPFTTTPGRGAAATAGGENVPCPPTSSAPSSGPVLGVNSCKYVTKTTTTMTRVDYDGGGGGGPSPPKRKHSREDVAANNEQEEHHLPKEDARQKQQTGGVTNRHRSSVALATHDSDDKECDSISSRSIFVSDDCDTTSSSTAINPPDERPPSTSELPSAPNDPAATRSSTFGYSPPKRTYGAGKQTPKKLPFVSLIKTNFVQSAAEATTAAEVTLVNGKKAVDGNSTGKVAGPEAIAKGCEKEGSGYQRSFQ